MPVGRSITYRLILVITLCTGLIFALILGYSYYSSRTMLRAELENDARNLAMSLVYRVEARLISVGKAAEGVARALETARYDQAELSTLIRETIQANPAIYGSTVAFEPFAFSSKQRLFAPYYHRNNGRLSFSRLEDSYQQTPYLEWDWYRIPLRQEQSVWSEPYFDEGAGNVFMSTFSVPFYDTTKGTRRIRGIVTADIALASLTEMITSVKVLRSGYAALISHRGMLLSHPERGMETTRKLSRITDEPKDSALHELSRQTSLEKPGFILHTARTGDRSWIYYAPIQPTGWILAVVFPESELFENISRLSIHMAAMGLAGILLLTIAVVLIARSITNPLKRLSRATAGISRGNFDVKLPTARYHDEVGALSEAFDTMRNALREHIRMLTETTAAKERIESELNIAHNIQMGLLHKVFPPFPDRSEFDLYALMEPAREVGGDFYDFFMVDSRRLCFVIADVSDKGVPSALFMAMSMTLLRSTAREGLAPDEVLFRVNNELARENDTCMFVTTFCAILDTDSGEVQYANAGHNPPLHLCADGSAVFLPRSGSLMVGAMEGTPYHCQQLLLKPGEGLLLYTDGVTEAMNNKLEQFSEKRLESSIEALRGRNLQDTVSGILADIHSFTGQAEQSDDITIMMIQYRGN
ncbi:MAG TPA: SpoIIE family protein phosphatase [Deltaproteobacteria bacterium]|nr:SpoIIE family protein phosphatase [Deltaproteobacteria bacterium]